VEQNNDTTGCVGAVVALLLMACTGLFLLWIGSTFIVPLFTPEAPATVETVREQPPIDILADICPGSEPPVFQEVGSYGRVFTQFINTEGDIVLFSMSGGTVETPVVVLKGDWCDT
jgi:hypothetical protein